MVANLGDEQGNLHRNGAKAVSFSVERIAHFTAKTLGDSLADVPGISRHQVRYMP